MTEPTKSCNKCLMIKPLSEYHKGRKTCKDCRKIYNAEAYEKNKDKLSVYHAKRYQMQKDLKNVEDFKF